MIFQRLSHVTGRMLVAHKMGYGVVLLVLVTGCTTFDQRAGFSDVRAAIHDRSGKRVIWNLGTELDAHVAQEVQTLLQGKLTADTAVQVALLNNRDLQAMYAELGVAQADLVQAGLLKNPLFDFSATFPIAGGAPDLELRVAMGFLNIFFMPLRKRVAAARFEDAKLQVTGAVLDVAARTRAALYRHQANAQMLELQQTIAQGLAVALDVTRRLYEAGNVTDLDLARERALAEEAKLQLASAEMAVRQSRENLHALLGLWGQQTAWDIDRRLPDMPAEPIPVDDLERVGLHKSLDLASARQRLIVAGEQAGLARATALVPESHLGGTAERSDSEWEAGPTIEFPIPLFDQGQARTGRAVTELRRAQQAYYALAVQIRSSARRVRDRVQGARARVLYYRDIMLPLRERIVNETQLQYNAMQLGVFDLLRARERQIQAAGAYIESLLAYWLARTDLGHILSGRLPGAGSVAMVRMDRAAGAAANGGH